MTQQAGFIHSVYFWLRVDGDKDDALQLARGCRKHLTNIPGVQRLSVGVPAGTPRDVVDNTYGVMLQIEFADTAAQDVYQIHPDHLLFIAACSHLWSRVQIYDALPAGE